MPQIWHYFPVGRSFRKSITLYHSLHHSMPGISAALKLAHHIACGNHATLTGGPNSLCQSNTMSIRFSVQSWHQPILASTSKMKEVRHHLSTTTGPFWENQAMQKQKEHESREKRTHMKYHRHNSVSEGPKSKHKGPTLCELLICLTFFET